MSTWIFSLQDAPAKQKVSWRTPPIPPTVSSSSYPQVDGTRVSEPAPPDGSTAFSPRLWEPWTHITPPLSEPPPLSGTVFIYFLRSHAFCNSSQRLSFECTIDLSSLFFNSPQICWWDWGLDWASPSFSMFQQIPSVAGNSGNSFFTSIMANSTN